MELDYKDDCGFSRENKWFRYRAGAIIIENGHVLVAGNDTSEYFYSVGGGVHLGEKAEDAVIREVFEETGIRYQIDRLLVIHENFFMGDNLTADLFCHEVSFYFLMKSKGNRKLNSNSQCLYGKEHMTWIPIEELQAHRVYPTFLPEILTNLPKEIKHIVTREYS